MCRCVWGRFMCREEQKGICSWESGISQLNRQLVVKQKQEELHKANSRQSEKETEPSSFINQQRHGAVIWKNSFLLSLQQTEKLPSNLEQQQTAPETNLKVAKFFGVSSSNKERLKKYRHTVFQLIVLCSSVTLPHQHHNWTHLFFQQSCIGWHYKREWALDTLYCTVDSKCYISTLFSIVVT